MGLWNLDTSALSLAREVRHSEEPWDKGYRLR